VVLQLNLPRYLKFGVVLSLYLTRYLKSGVVLSLYLPRYLKSRVVIKPLHRKTQILQNISYLNVNDRQTQRFEISISFCIIILLVVVTTAIYFDYHIAIAAIKIDNVITNYLLPVEIITPELLVLYLVPEKYLR